MPPWEPICYTNRPGARVVTRTGETLCDNPGNSWRGKCIIPGQCPPTSLCAENFYRGITSSLWGMVPTTKHLTSTAYAYLELSMSFTGSAGKANRFMQCCCLPSTKLREVVQTRNSWILYVVLFWLGLAWKSLALAWPGPGLWQRSH
jgi:hypothetical protein